MLAGFLPQGRHRQHHLPAAPSQKRLWLSLILSGVLVIGIIWAGILYHLDLRRRSIITSTHQDVTSLSVALEQQVARLLVSVDQVLAFMQQDFAEDPKGFDFQAWVRRATSLKNIANQISIYNENGELVALRDTPATGTPRFDIRDRAYFRHLSTHPDTSTYIDRTVRGRVSGRYVFQLARRLNHPNGSFAGVIVVSLLPEHLSEQFKALDVGAEGSVNLLGRDGYARARFPEVKGMFERNITTLTKGEGVFAHLRRSPNGSYEVTSAFDGITRIFGYRTVGDTSLVVVIGRSLDVELAPFETERTTVVIVGAGATVAILGLLGLLAWQLAGRRKAELAYRTSEGRYRLLTDTTSDVIVRLDLDFRHAFISGACRELFGYAPEEMIGADPSEAMHQEDAPRVRERARLLLAGEIEGDADTVIYRSRHKDGHWVWVENKVKLARNARSGRPESIVCSMRDIGERIQAATALASSEALYRRLADTATDMIAQLDMTGRRLYVSPASKDLLGYEPSELIGTRPRDSMHPDDIAAFSELVARLQDGRSDRAVSVNRLRHRDGRWIWVEAHLHVIKEDGVRTGFLAAVRDVTERKRAEERLRESEHRFRLLAENTSELIMLGHDDGRRSYVSPAAQRLLGFSPDELAAMRLRDYVHPNDLTRLYETTSRLGDSVPEVMCVYRALNRDKGWISVEGTFRRIPDAGGDEPSIVATFRDVTEREHQAELLEQAAAAADAGARIQAEFLANMSHELRTPLTGMLGVHDMLRSDPSVSERQRHLIGLAHDSGRSLLAIVNDILDFSKIEAGQLALETLPFGLRNLLDGCRQLAGETIKGKAIVLDITVPDAVPDWFVGDATRLRQVLLNLLTNAAKFTSEGRITVTASYDANGKALRVEVADTGIGIPADKLPLLFARFSQADASTSRRYGGTGLGLAICKRLVELMGGEIGVASQSECGSTFWFSVPLASAEGSNEPAAVTMLLSSPSGRAYRLLVAEDNVVNQQILRGVLEQQGHRLTLVGDGAMALEARQTGGPFDMILMDVQMPCLDGIEAARAIRVWEGALGHRPIPIIALTANALPEEVNRCREAGMDAHVAKPIDWDTLFSTMDRLNGDREDQEPHAGSSALLEAPVLDFALLEELAEMLGPKAMSRLMASFVAEISKRVAAMGLAPADEVARHAHVLVALAGQLGFTELSVFCAGLEQTAHAGEALDDPGRLSVVAERALRAAAATPYARALAAA